jgi:hypothetical protein
MYITAPPLRLYYWGMGPVKTLAQGVKTALDTQAIHSR